MMSSSTIVLVFIYGLTTGLALECPTCRGDGCDGAIPVLECTRNVPTLPFKLQSRNIAKFSQVACLNLEYFENGELQQIKQCHPTSDKTDLCKDIKASLNEYAPMVSCSTGQGGGSEPFLDTDVGSGDGDGDGDGDGGGGAITHTVSTVALFAFLAFLVM